MVETSSRLAAGLFLQELNPREGLVSGARRGDDEKRQPELWGENGKEEGEGASPAPNLASLIQWRKGVHARLLLSPPPRGGEVGPNPDHDPGTPDPPTQGPGCSPPPQGGFLGDTNIRVSKKTSFMCLVSC